jgi:Glycosyl transferase family 2
VPVVDGDSTDGTCEFFESRGVRVIRRARRGWGEAFRLAARYARNEFLVFFQMSIRALQLGHRVPEIPTRKSVRIGRGVSKLDDPRGAAARRSPRARVGPAARSPLTTGHRARRGGAVEERSAC